MTIQPSDLFLINRGGTNYQITYSDLLAGTGVLATDEVMVQRGGTLYSLTYENLGVSGATLQATDMMLVQRGDKLYSQEITGQLISSGAWLDLAINPGTASDPKKIVGFTWTGGREVNGVPPQIVNSSGGKVVYLGPAGTVFIDQAFCGSSFALRLYGQFDQISFRDSKGLEGVTCSTASSAGWATVIPNPSAKQGYEMFDMCSNLTTIDRFIPLRDMTRMFRLCGSFNSSVASNLQTGQVTTMRDCFNSCSSFDQPLSVWDTSSCTNMAGMFSGCSSFNRNINNWQTGLVTDFTAMFSGASAYNSPMYLWDTSSIAASFSMNKMFYNATIFNKDLNNWCVTKIPNTPSQFKDNSALTQANEPYWGTCP